MTYMQQRDKPGTNHQQKPQILLLSAATNALYPLQLDWFSSI